MKKLLVVLLILILCLHGCTRGRKKNYECNYDEITSIKIVRLDGVDENYYDYEYTTICNITDISSFTKNFQDIEQRDYFTIFGDPSTVDLGDLVFKFEFDNGDMDYISPEVQSQLRSGKWSYPSINFNREDFYALMFDCLQAEGDQVFYLMHESINISSIQIVKSTNEEELKHEVISEIENYEEFLTDLSEIDYSSANVVLNNLNWKFTDKDLAVKINYENGDYEVFSHDCREEFRSNSYDANTYIGTFDSEQFYSLLSEYINN